MIFFDQFFVSSLTIGQEWSSYGGAYTYLEAVLQLIRSINSVNKLAGLTNFYLTCLRCLLFAMERGSIFDFLNLLKMVKKQKNLNSFQATKYKNERLVLKSETEKEILKPWLRTVTRILNIELTFFESI